MFAVSEAVILFVPMVAIFGIPGVLVAARMTPNTRLAYGVTILTLGAVTFFVAQGTPYAGITLVFGGVGASAATWAVFGIAQRLPIQRQVRDALQRIEELRAGVERARGDRRAATEYLHAKGITLPEARRIVLRYLRGDAPTATGRSTTQEHTRVPHISGSEQPDLRIQRRFGPR